MNPHIEVQEFVRRLKMLMDLPDSRFTFFLGAGCSVSSGIPTAGKLVKDWLPKLKRLKKGSEDNLEEWVRNEFSNNAAPSYGTVMEALFLTPEERQHEIEKLTEGKDPDFSYGVLAQMMSHEEYGSHCNTVLTTNFDDMVADALYLYSNKKPLVISHDSLIGFVRISRTRPLVIKLHGDARLAPRNTELETQELDEAVKKVLKNLLSETGLIFIGYGGNDNSILNILKELPKGALPWGVYWINNDIPQNDMGSWLESRNAIWVKHCNFFELMAIISNEFELRPIQMERFVRLLHENVDTVVEYYEKADEADHTYPNILANSASLLTIYKDNDRAEECYEKAIHIAPDNFNAVSNYAIFLEKVRKDYDKAEKHYKQAIKIDSNHASLLGNYANLLRNIRKAYDKAETYYKRAIEMDSNHDTHLGNYAALLLAQGREEGFDLLQRALKRADNPALLLECWFYQYAHTKDENIRQQSLAEIKALIIKSRVRSPGWVLEDNVKKAIADGHPEPQFLETLAKVIISDESNVKELEKYDSWTNDA
jgi:tetratricopeptide (TPR) repeat protein